MIKALILSSLVILSIHPSSSFCNDLCYFQLKEDSLSYSILKEKGYQNLNPKEQAYFKTRLVQLLKKDKLLQEMTLLRKENFYAYYHRIKTVGDTSKKAPKDYEGRVGFYRKKGVADPEKFVKNSEKINKTLLYSVISYPELYRLPDEVVREIQKEAGIGFETSLNKLNL